MSGGADDARQRRGGDDDDLSYRSDVAKEDLYESDDDDHQFARRRIIPHGECIPFTKAHLLNDPNNQRAAEVMDDVSAVSTARVRDLDITYNEAYIPGSSQERNISTAENAMKHEKGLTVYSIRRDDGKIKAGRSAVPDKRWEGKYKANSKYVAETARVGIPFERLKKESVTAVEKTVEEIAGIKGVSLKDVKLDTLTVDEAIEVGKNGLEMPVRLLIWSLTDHKGKKMSKGRELGGLDRAFFINILEDGYFHHLKEEYGVAMVEEANQREHLQSSGLKDWVKPTMEAACASGEALLKAIVAKGGEKAKTWLLGGHKPIIQNAWAANLDDPGQSATGIIFDAILNQKNTYDEGVWDDAFVGKPKIVRGSRFNAKEGFRPPKRKQARGRQQGKLTAVKTNGGVGYFNISSEAHRDNGSSIFVYLHELGYGDPIHCYLDTEAYFQVTAEGVFSLVIVFNPLCDIFHSDRNTYAIGWHQFVRQAKKAASAHYLQAVIWKLQEPSDDLSVEGNLSYWQNFPVAFLSRAVGFFNWHLHPFVATKVGEAPLDVWRNMLSSENHGLAASKYGVNLREQTRERRKDERVDINKTRDSEKHRHVVNCISRSRSDADLDTCINAAAQQYIWLARANGGEQLDTENNCKKKLDDLEEKFLCEGSQLRSRLGQVITAHYAEVVAENAEIGEKRATEKAAKSKADMEARKEAARKRKKK